MVIRTPKAVIFDMDGTLIDNYSYHIEAWYVICKKYNAPKSKKYIITHLHGTNHEVCKTFFGSEISAEQSAKIGLEKEALYRELYAPHIRPIDGLTEFLVLLQKKDIPMAVGTMGNKENADFTLNQLDIRHYFKTVLTAEDVTHGKPNPEIFLSCLHALPLSSTLLKDEIWIFEDTSSGIEAATRAGGKAIGILSSKSKSALKNVGAAICIKNYHEIVKLIT
jgi:HAD superfamily hydrolase (TIGR01509 family)